MQRQTKLSNNQIELHKCHLRLGTENLIYLIIKVSKKFPNEPWGFGVLGFWGFGGCPCDSGVRSLCLVG